MVFSFPLWCERRKRIFGRRVKKTHVSGDLWQFGSKLCNVSPSIALFEGTEWTIVFISTIPTASIAAIFFLLTRSDHKRFFPFLRNLIAVGEACAFFGHKHKKIKLGASTEYRAKFEGKTNYLFIFSGSE